MLNVIDYSHLHYVLLHDDRIPPRREGKFVVMKNGDKRHVVFSPRGLSVFHANIVERFLNERGITGQYNAKRDVFYFLSSEWEVEGGGHWSLDETGGSLCISGKSLAYGSVDLEELALQLGSVEAFQGVRVAITG